MSENTKEELLDKMLDVITILALNSQSEHVSQAIKMETVVHNLLRRGLPGRATEDDLWQLSILLRRPDALHLAVTQMHHVEHSKQLAEILIGLEEQKVLTRRQINEADNLALFRRFMPTDDGYSDHNIRTHIANAFSNGEAHEEQ